MPIKVYRNDIVEPYDIDETLVMHDYEAYPNSDKIQVWDTSLNGRVTLAVNTNMVKLLKHSRTKGAVVIAWSRGGVEWAEAVIKALDLERYVDIILSKPRVYFDDTDVSSWLKDRVYIGPNVKYKQTT